MKDAVAIPALILLLLTGEGAYAAIPGPPRALSAPHSVTSSVDAAARALDLAALFEVKDIAGAGWIDRHTVVVSSNISGRFNLWRVSLDDGARLQLTRSDERHLAPVVSPDGQWVVFETDRGGGEMFDLAETPATGGPVVRLTDTPDISETDAVFSRDGRRLAFSMKRRGAAATNVAILDLDTHAVTVLTTEQDPQYRWVAVAFAPDGQSLIANRSNVLSSRASVWRVPIGGGPPIDLTPHPGDVVTLASDLSPDGRTVAIVTNAGSEQNQAGLLDFAAGTIRMIAASPWRQTTSHFSPNGQTLLYGVNQDGRSEVYLYDLAKGVSIRAPVPVGVNGPVGSAFSSDGRKILVAHQSSNMPLDLWTVDLASDLARPVTHFAPPTLTQAHLPASQLVHYASRDGTIISAFVWVPANLPRDGHAPAVLFPHGGPTGQINDFFNRDAVALAADGFVVMAPNFRGSTGFGRQFQLANIKDLGGGDLEDVIAGAAFLERTGFVDPKKVGIYGGSYGGFMTLMALAKTPGLWAAGVDMFGILDWRSMVKQSDPQLQVYVRGLLGDPGTNGAVYDADSPLTYLDQLKAPLLLQQGDNDIRVPKAQTEDVVSRLKAAGKIVDVVYFPNEGHGFFKKENQIESLKRTLAWFDRYLKSRN